MNNTQQILSLKDKQYEGTVVDGRFMVNNEPLMGAFKTGVGNKNDTTPDFIKVEETANGGVQYIGAETMKYAILIRVILPKKTKVGSHSFNNELSDLAKTVLGVITDKWVLVSEIAKKAGITGHQLKGPLAKLNQMELVELKKGKMHTRYVRLKK